MMGKARKTGFLLFLAGMLLALPLGKASAPAFLDFLIEALSRRSGLSALEVREELGLTVGEIRHTALSGLGSCEERLSPSEERKFERWLKTGEFEEALASRLGLQAHEIREAAVAARQKISDRQTIPGKRYYFELEPEVAAKFEPSESGQMQVFIKPKGNKFQDQETEQAVSMLWKLGATVVSDRMHLAKLWSDPQIFNTLQVTILANLNQVFKIARLEQVVRVRLPMDQLNELLAKPAYKPE